MKIRIGTKTYDRSQECGRRERQLSANVIRDVAWAPKPANPHAPPYRWAR